MYRETFLLLSPAGKPISGDIRVLNDGKKKPVIIICHGFMAFKDWGMYPFIGEEFARKGFASVVFNFSHNGIGERIDRITDYQAFAQNTFSKELLDLQFLLDEICTGQLKREYFDTAKIALVSHSRGCGICLVQSAKDERINALAAWSPIATFDRWTDVQKKRWRLNGFLPASNKMELHPLKLGIQLLEDLETNADTLNIESAVARLHIPLLIVQGTEDTITPPEEAQRLLECSNKTTTELLLLEHVGHLYNAFNKENNDSATVQHILDVTTAFFHLYI
jgi:alpha-beta hydrolase superfamily lysophospholipase